MIDRIWVSLFQSKENDLRDDWNISWDKWN